MKKYDLAVIGGGYAGVAAALAAARAVQTKTVHAEASGDIEAQAQHVKLGKDLSLVQKVARADHVNSELSEIQSALDDIVTAFNTHVHASSGATPTPTTINSYIAGNTDARSVFAD